MALIVDQSIGKFSFEKRPTIVLSFNTPRKFGNDWTSSSVGTRLLTPPEVSRRWWVVGRSSTETDCWICSSFHLRRSFVDLFSGRVGCGSETGKLWLDSWVSVGMSPWIPWHSIINQHRNSTIYASLNNTSLSFVYNKQSTFSSRPLLNP